ncbi:MAG: hypothetical protein IPL39_14400 [Opitutaceae bacterium]|nr:hypothetical protein [Opitutaceae bacterium]
MGKGAVDQTPAESKTDVVSAYDESFSVSEDGRPIPVVRGQRKIALRFVLCPFYGQRVWEEPPKNRENNMGGGKGSAQGTKHVNGTIAGIIGMGPLYAVDAIILNGETVGQARSIGRPQPIRST